MDFINLKFRLLGKLKNNLEIISRKSNYQFSEDLLKKIEENERIVKILEFIDIKLKSNNPEIEKSKEIENLIMECSHFQEILEKNWMDSTNYIKKELNEIEVINQLGKSLYKRKI